MISQEYKLLLQKEHRINPDWGNSAAFWIDDINKHIKDSASVLDYGCGKGILSQLIKQDVFNYDPAMDIDERQEVDFLVCVDVLEHVEDEYLHDVLSDMVKYPRKGFFIAVHTRKANHYLSNGQNAHINIKSHDEWRRILSMYMNAEYEITGNYLIAYA